MNSKPVRRAIVLGRGCAGTALLVSGVAGACLSDDAVSLPWQVAAVQAALPPEPLPPAPAKPPSVTPPNAPPVVPPTPVPLKKNAKDQKSAPPSPGARESTRPRVLYAPAESRTAEEASARAADPKDPSGALIVPPLGSGAAPSKR